MSSVQPKASGGLICITVEKRIYDFSVEQGSCIAIGQETSSQIRYIK